MACQEMVASGTSPPMFSSSGLTPCRIDTSVAGSYSISFSILGSPPVSGSSGGSAVVRTLVVQSAACGLSAAISGSVSQDSLVSSLAGEDGMEAG